MTNAAKRYIGAIDQGTTSTRFMIFDHDGREVAKHQLEHEQILPRAGWVEHNPVEIWERSVAVVQTALNRASLQPSDLAAVGITNQRETAVVWDRRSGRPYYNAIVWHFRSFGRKRERIRSWLTDPGAPPMIRLTSPRATRKWLASVHRAGLPDVARG